LAPCASPGTPHLGHPPVHLVGPRAPANWEAQHGKGKALSILAHKLGRAACYVLLREKAFERERFLRTSH
jgi:hypothetical protein